MELVWYMFLVQVIVIYVRYTQEAAVRDIQQIGGDIQAAKFQSWWRRRDIFFFFWHQSMWRVRCLPPPLTRFSLFANLPMCNSLANYIGIMWWLYTVFIKTKWDTENTRHMHTRMQACISYVDGYSETMEVLYYYNIMWLLFGWRRVVEVRKTENFQLELL